MILEIILLTVAIIWLISASLFDIKTREIPDWLNYSLILMAFFIRGLMSITTKNPSYIITSLIGFAVLFGFANLMYYTKQWGGGDAKLAIAFGILFASYPETLLKIFTPNLNVPFLLSIFINVLIIGAIFSIFYSIYLSLKNKEKYLNEHRKIIKNKSLKFLEIFSILIFIILTTIVLIFVQNTILKILLILIFAFPLIFIYIYLFVKVVEKITMYKTVKTSNLTEGDWIIQDIKIKNKLIYSSKSPGVTKKQIQELIKSKIKTVKIKEGIPFVPSFLIGLIISLIFGNLILPI